MRRQVVLFVAAAVQITARQASGQAIPAVKQLIAEASVRNRLPSSLISYKANVETEIAVVLRREEGTEAVAAVEQVASAFTWNRTGDYEQRVQGYRAQQTGGNVSMLTLFQTGWLQPALYGNRLRVRPRGTSGRSQNRAASTRSTTNASDTLPAVHPLATDREDFYAYSGGDTVVVMRAGDRTIPIVHVRVRPREGVAGKAVLFDGEMDLDASRGTLVRLRGYFVRNSASRSWLARSLADAVAYVEYEQAERLGDYWLPAKQRIELQASVPVIGEGRAIIRIVSTFFDMRVNDTVLDPATLAIADSLRAVASRRLTYAPGDSLNAYGRWRTTLGSITDGMRADDFQDIGPDQWRTSGSPRLDLAAPRGADVMHFNRVEGLYTGLGARWSLRDVAPGVVVRANAGYAWAEETVRGRLSVVRTRGPWTIEARVGRSMDITNDFRVPLDSGNTFSALFGSIDAYDYVSRSFGALGVVRQVGSRRWLVRADVGYADDRYRSSQYLRGPFGGDLFRENRGVAEGGYLRSSSTIEWQPDRAAEFLKPGVGARLYYERGDGTLDYQRVEARVSGRRAVGPLVFAARADIGVVAGGRIPPQQLFEVGKYQNLPGYADKEFAGSRAAVLRASAIYTTPYLRNPVRLGRNLWLPAAAPGFSLGVQGGWTDAPTAAARTAIAELNPAYDPRLTAVTWVPVSVPSDRVRATVTAGMRFFGNALFLGVARPVDQAAEWKGLVGFGQAW